MSDNMKIDAALVQLEAGKFSFQMVDAIKDHVAGLEKEMAALRASQDNAITEMKRQEYAIWRLEAEARKLNATIYALLKANAMTEIVCRESAALSVKLGEYLAIGAQLGRAALERAIADIQAGKPQAELAKANATLRAFVKEHGPTEQQIRDAIAQIEPQIDAMKKRLGPSVEKMSAYVSNLKKNVA
ncbi:hypothetical protein [Methylocystis echinoides]|uniref:Uncharacterized protein n=1 Tax=Methylocystis echinoides TaxID=29468 RepID=A0A9W6LTC8_9HYPH|nr:hypothetical protein [Methylocystis echinoides]GLI94508.1 hypothetical protein LMG27198_35000 [Methylocystis echinoides]